MADEVEAVEHDVERPVGGLWSRLRHLNKMQLLGIGVAIATLVVGFLAYKHMQSTTGTAAGTGTTPGNPLSSGGAGIGADVPPSASNAGNPQQQSPGVLATGSPDTGGTSASAFTLNPGPAFDPGTVDPGTGYTPPPEVGTPAPADAGSLAAAAAATRSTVAAIFDNLRSLAPYGGESRPVNYGAGAAYGGITTTPTVQQLQSAYAGTSLGEGQFIRGDQSQNPNIPLTPAPPISSLPVAAHMAALPAAHKETSAPFAMTSIVARLSSLPNPFAGAASQHTQAPAARNQPAAPAAAPAPRATPLPANFVPQSAFAGASLGEGQYIRQPAATPAASGSYSRRGGAF